LFGVAGPPRGQWCVIRTLLLSLADFDKRVAPRLLGHTPNYFNTACLPLDCDPQADCPIWKYFLDDVLLGRADLPVNSFIRLFSRD
jgi:hypothetical protein